MVGVAEAADAQIEYCEPQPPVFLNLGMTAIILVGAYRVNGGVSLPGKIIAFLNYFTNVLLAAANER